MLGRPWSSRLRDDQGSATAETAIVLPIVVLMAAVLAAVALGLGAQLRMENAARITARELARGTEASIAVDAGVRAGGTGTQIQVSPQGEWVQVSARRRIELPVLAANGKSWEVKADAVARLEPYLITGGTP